jgi:hypothetical protein
VSELTLRATSAAPAWPVTPNPPPVPALPIWPLTVMFGLLPLWWALGLFFLGWPAFGAVLLALLVVRGRLTLPAGSACWLTFLALATLSAVQLDRPSALPFFLLRIGDLVTALVVGVYVYTLLREQAPWSKVIRPLCLFWLAVVALGWLGVLMPALSVASVLEMALPHGLVGQPYLNDLLHLHGAEYNHGLEVTTARPSAPYAYTNSWGSAYSVGVPCVLAYVMSVRRGPLRTILLVALPLSLVPAFLTLNRGMLICLGVAVTVLAGRALLRGQTRVAASALGVAALGAFVSLVIPISQLIGERLSNSGSNADRRELYLATVRAVARSPLLGYGAPASLDTTSARAPLGTQGQLWQVMFSHGVPALLCFLGYFVIVTWRLAPAVSAAGQWLSTIPVVALVQTPFYGFTDPNLSLMFFAIAAGLAAVDGPINRQPRPVRG